VLPSACVTTLGDRNKLISERYQHFRERGLPCGLHDSLCTLHLFCSPRIAELRHRRNTRYGWVANPYPTGTCTPQDAPSFAWRANAAPDQRARFLARLRPGACCAIYFSLIDLFKRNISPLSFLVDANLNGLFKVYGHSQKGL